jgi:hypothetical protein
MTKSGMGWDNKAMWLLYKEGKSSMNKIRFGIISLSQTDKVFRCKRNIVSADRITGYKTTINYPCFWIYFL